MFKPLRHRKAVTALMTAALALTVMAPSAQAVTTISANLDTDGTLTADGVVTLGNGTATAAVNTSDWGITTAGAMTGVSFDANGTGNSLSNVDAADLTIDSLDFAQFADALSIDSATVTGTWTDLGSVTTVDINGGSLDGVIIGGASPAAATLTTLSMSDLATWSAGAAITAGSYQIGRDADATNQLHFNVPTGASMEWSVNDAPVMTLSGTGIVIQGATGGVQPSGTKNVAVTAGSAATSGNVYNINSELDIAAPSNSTSNFYSIRGQAGVASGTSDYSASMNALAGTFYGTPGGTVASGIGVNALAYNSGAGTVTQLVGGRFRAYQTAAGGTVNNAYNILVSDPAASGTIDNHAGIFIEEITGATKNTDIHIGSDANTALPAGNWAIYSASTRASSFAGDVAVRHLGSTGGVLGATTGTCETPSALGSDLRGSATTTAGTTGCDAGETIIVNFSTAYTTAPYCVISPATATAVTGAAHVASGTSSMTITPTVATGGTATWNYHCIE